MEYGPCQTCKSDRVGFTYFALGSHLSLTINGDVYQGEVPMDTNLGQGKSVRLSICMDCGQVQGKWPMTKSIQEMRKESEEPDPLVIAPPKTKKKKSSKKTKKKVVKKTVKEGE